MHHPKIFCAIALLAMAAAPATRAAEIVIDNGDFGSGYAVTGVTEQAGTGDAFGGDQAFNNTSGNLTQNATYTFSGLDNGLYEIFASWRAAGQGNVSFMRVAVSDGGPTVELNQQNIGPSADLLINDGSSDVNFQSVGQVSVSDGEIVVTTSLGTSGSPTFFVNDAIALSQLTIDSDGDGMPDTWEEENGLNKLTDDASGNPDGDGLTNLEEFQRNTNPQDSDSDDDGLFDEIERNTGFWASATDTGTDPNNSDTDGDGLLDGVENNTGTWVSPNQTGTNPHLPDSDSDGIGDATENPDLPFVDATQPGTDPNISDSDGDSHRDGIEVFGGSDPTDPASTPNIVSTSNDIVINEVHYDPAEKTVPAEFIEIYNQGPEAVNLLGWELTDAVTFIFPNFLLAPGEFVVVAQDPPTALAEFGVSTLGPWVGKLANDGERIVLRDGAGTKIDEVDYGVDFPWPTAAQGDGPSMELIHPSLDNDLGGSWRSASSGFSGPTMIFLTGDNPGWRYRRGPSSPIADGAGRQWTENGYDESVDGQWLTGQTPIGYGDGDDNTTLSDMRGNYIDVFLRHEFTIAPGQPIPSSLLLRCYFDDGCVVYINDHEVERFSLPTGAIPSPPPDGFATSHEAAWDESILTGASAYLQEGTNTIAIQIINTTIGSGDLSIDAELRTPPTGSTLGFPTPGAPNSVFSPSAPPQIRQVAHLPVRPLTGEDVLVTAKITDPQGVPSATLHYQIVDPGNYLRLTDSAYETDWTDIAMHDDGLGGDTIAGDGQFTALLPADLQIHRRLIRYRISALDDSGTSVRVPYVDDPQPNFAYFCYDGVPAWTGANRPGVSSPETFSSALLESIPVYHLIATGPDIASCQYSSGSRNTRFLGTLIYDGEVYDHVEFNIRGQGSTYRTGKNKWHFRFRRGHHFQARDNYGKKYKSRWKDMKVNGGTAPWTYVNRGMAGVDECISYRLLELAGVPSSRTSYFHFRVIDGATEANPSDQYDGDIWGLYFSVEVPDGRFLDDRSLPDGNVYKLENPLNQDNQGVDEPIGPSDGNAIRSRMSTSRTQQWWQDNADHVTYARFKGVAEAVTHYDQRDGQQGYYYHNPETDKWVFMPWDLDTMFQLTHKYYTWDRFRLCIDSRYTANLLEARNQQREILDLLFNEKAVDTVMAELVDIVNPPGQALTWADVDQFVWNYHNRTPGQFKGSFNVLTGNSNPAGVVYSRTLISADHEGQMDYMRKFMRPGGHGYDNLVDEVADAAIPTKPTITYTGTAGFPLDDLQFRSSAFGDPNGIGTFAAMEWRLAEVSDPTAPNYDPDEVQPYEVDAVWESDELTTFSSDAVVPPALVAAGATYRARVRHKDTSGRWSHWSDPVEFTATLPLITPYLDGLVVSEVMYNPTGGGNLEFIEIMNVGPDSLDLTPIAFTQGIEFDFASSNITSINSGARVLVVKNTAAFEALHGGGLPIAGEYQFSNSNSLNNNGEQIVLSFGAGTAIRDFTYDDELPWPTAPDGDGASLVLINPEDTPDHNEAANWRPSALTNGNPGTSDAIPFTGGDLLSHALANLPTVQQSVEATTLRYERILGTDDVEIVAEWSDDLVTWSATALTFVAETPSGTGTSTVTWTLPLGERGFARLRISER